MDGARPFALLPLESAAHPRSEAFMPPTRPSEGVDVQLAAGATIAPWTGTPPRRVVAVVTSGALLLSVGSRRGPTAVAVLGPGDVFGLDAFDGREGFDPAQPRDPPTTRWPVERATALVPSGVTLLAPEIMALQAARDPAAAWSVLSAVAGLGTRLSQRLAGIVAQPVEERLLAELRTLAARHGRSCPFGRRIELPLTQELLASLVGATRESVNRALGRLFRQGLVRRAGRGYVVVSSAPAVDRGLDGSLGGR